MDASVASEPAASPDEAPTSRGETKLINLALQGGGARRAFTRGVLDRLLEDDCIGFDGISATSAGAMNATMLAPGMAAGGREGAKKALAEFWRFRRHPGVAEEQRLEPFPGHSLPIHRSAACSSAKKSKIGSSIDSVSKLTTTQ